MSVNNDKLAQIFALLLDDGSSGQEQEQQEQEQQKQNFLDKVFRDVAHLR